LKDSSGTAIFSDAEKQVKRFPDNRESYYFPDIFRSGRKTGQSGFRVCGRCLKRLNCLMLEKVGLVDGQ
jgi:hypothetical protein